jgi:hypothetical protein
MFIDVCEVYCEMIHSFFTIIIHSLVTIICAINCVAKTILNLSLRKFELLNAKLCKCKILPKFFALIFERQFVFGKLLYELG